MANKKMAKPKQVKKGRDWTFLVYPESAPKNWRSILDGTHMRWIESPLHDRDTNPDGSKKKPHWHIMLSADGPITERQVENIIKPLNGPVAQKVGSAVGMVRYMCHMDNPEKFQYSMSDIIGHCGADVGSYFKMTETSRINTMKEMVQYTYDNGIDNYADFLMYCISGRDDDTWFEVAIDHNTLALNKLIDGVWQKKHNGNW